MGDTSFSMSPYIEFSPLAIPQKHKCSKWDELPVIWSEGPKKGKMMTEDDFPKPYGTKYSEWINLIEKY